MQTTRWPQGRKTTPTSALKQTLHCICLLIVSFSISISLEQLLHPEQLEQSPGDGLAGDGAGGWDDVEGRDGVEGRESLSVDMLLFLSFSFFLSSLKSHRYQGQSPS